MPTEDGASRKPAAEHATAAHTAVASPLLLGGGSCPTHLPAPAAAVAVGEKPFEDIMVLVWLSHLNKLTQFEAHVHDYKRQLEEAQNAVAELEAQRAAALATFEEQEATITRQAAMIGQQQSALDIFRACFSDIHAASRTATEAAAALAQPERARPD